MINVLKKINNLKVLICFFNIFIFLLSLFLQYNIKYELFYKNVKFNNKFSFKYFNNTGNNNDYFNMTFIGYNFSFKYNIFKVEYNIGFFNEYNNLISPSDLKIYNNLTIVCHISIKNYDYDYDIEFLPNIYKNKYYSCIEFLNINEKANFGIKIYQLNENEENIKQFFIINLFKENIFSFKYLINNKDIIFDPLIINEEYISIIKKMNDRRINETLKLKNSYIQYPYSTLKRKVIINENIWIFANFYNLYYCFCKGKNCSYVKIPQKCKFYFYLYLIDNNRNLYKKTDFLFVDFIFAELSSDDVFPVFKVMQKKGLPVHYITEKDELYKEYCHQYNNCLTIIQVKRENYYNSGDFLEKYLNLFLKLRAVISGKYTNLHLISNLFYNIEYITYIAVGHGVCFFKDYLFSEYRIYGKKKNDKILIPPSEKLISVAKKYNWNDEDIIKINLPRWDKYNTNNISFINNREFYNNNSIFLMFTWRDLKFNKEISLDYIENIDKILNNKYIYKELVKKNGTLYFTFHRNLRNKYHYKYENILKKKHKIYKWIQQSEISECLSKTSLVITDFSSIIFDLIYRRKPYILFIPDAYDINLENIYKSDYVNMIESFKNGTIIFENIYLNINETINKIIYYINNNFNIEKKLEIFYNSFDLKKGNNINKFIRYLLNLKQ